MSDEHPQVTDPDAIRDAGGHILVTREELEAALKAGGVRLRDFEKHHREQRGSWVRRIDSGEHLQAHRERHGEYRLNDVAPDYGLNPEDLSVQDLVVIWAWEEIRGRIRNDDIPRRPELARHIRDTHLRLPRDLRELIAGVLEGTVNTPRGPAPGRSSLSPADRLVRQTQAHRVMRWKRAFARYKQRHPGISLDPYRSALARVSEETGVPEDTLDKWCYPR